MVKISRSNYEKMACVLVLTLLLCPQLRAQVTLETQVKVTDSVMYFDGDKVDLDHTANSTTGYDYVYGTALTPHGDCVKSYKHFVYMTWYKGGKLNRHVMLTRYNTKTGVSKTIEFPHQHTGYDGKWWIGETHNTISVGICPKDSTVHMLYDLHRNGNITRDNIGTEDYLRYSFTETGGATVADEDFTIERFVNSEKGDYKHLSFNGIDNVTVTKLLTYPDFFTNDEGDLFMKSRFGYDRNGRILFARYDGEKWHGYTDFNRSNATNYGSAHNWGLYGDIKYVNGKIRIGFQRRSNDRTDKYIYQNGIYYAYSDDPYGLTQWKDYKANEFTRPLADADLIKVAEPGDWVETTQTDKVHIVSGFDWTVTDNEDIHMVSMVKDNQNSVTKKLHTYKKADDAEFTTVEYDAGSELYASGNDVYVIGLKSGRVNIVRTKGGTSNFEQVYQETSGPTFDKGVAKVNDGKLYYFLKESGGSGDIRTTYLQVFDLDIDTTPADTSRYLSFKGLVNNQEIAIGTNLSIEAKVGSAFKEVSLWSGDTNLGTLTQAPYQWSSHAILTDMTEPSYTFKLLAKDTADITVEASITITTPEVFSLSDKSSIHVSFEDEAISSWETDGADYDVVPTIADGTNVRAGSKVLALQYSSSTSGHHIQNTKDKVGVANGHYVHMISYTATSDTDHGYTFPTIKLGEWTPTPSFTSHAQANEFERKITSRQNTTGDSLNCYPRLRSKAQGGACTIYYDDIVLYTSESETVDLTAPTPAEHVVFNNSQLTWIPGADDETGIVSTLVLCSDNALAAAPQLQAQVAYSTADDASSISAVGDWTVLAVLPGDADTYTKVTDDNMEYKYAIVHRDLAYNYSEVILNTVPSTLENQVTKNFTCLGYNGNIAINGLLGHELVSVYSVNGSKVYDGYVNGDSLCIKIQQGVYFVKIDSEVVKVVVD